MTFQAQLLCKTCHDAKAPPLQVRNAEVFCFYHLYNLLPPRQPLLMQQNNCNHCIENDHYWLYSNPRKIKKKAFVFHLLHLESLDDPTNTMQIASVDQPEPHPWFPTEHFHRLNSQSSTATPPKPPADISAHSKKMTLQKQAVKNSTQSMYFHEKSLRVIPMCYLHCPKDGLHENYSIGTLFFHLFLPKSKP